METDGVDGLRAARDEALQQALAGLAEFARERFAGFGKPGRDGFAMETDGVDGLRAARDEALQQALAVLAEFARERVAGFGQPGRDGFAMETDGVDGLRAARIEPFDDLVAVSGDRFGRGLSGRRHLDCDREGLRTQRLDGARAGRTDALMEFRVAAIHFCDQRFRCLSDSPIDVGDPRQQTARAVVGRARQPYGDILAQSQKSLVQLIALGGDPFDGLGARAVHRYRDFLGRGAERAGDALTDLRNLSGDPLSDSFEVAGDRRMGFADRGADLPAIGEDRFALIGHFRDQAAKPALVLARGALQGRHFGAHELFEFGGPRVGALDPVSHRRDFAADRLGKREELLARHRLGLGQPHRHSRDRTGGKPELLKPARERCEREQENDGAERRQPEQRRFGSQQGSPRVYPRRERDVLIIGVDAAEQQPGERAQRRGYDRRLARPAHLQRLDDRPCAGAVVVRGWRFRRQPRRRLGRPRAARACEQRGIGRLDGGRRLEGCCEHTGGGRRRRGRRRRGRAVARLGRGGDRFRFGVEIQRVFDRKHRLRDGIRSRIVLRHLVRLVISSALVATARDLFPFAAAQGLAPHRAKGINQLAVYSPPPRMETSAVTHLSNVVNVWITIIKGGAPR